LIQVEHYLTEWASGEETSTTPFDESTITYYNNVDAHLKMLEIFREHSKTVGIVSKLQKKLFKNAWCVCVLILLQL